MVPRPSEPFSTFLGERLATLRFVTVAALKRLVSQSTPEDVASVAFAVGTNPTEQFPIVVFAWDKNGMPLNYDNSSYVRQLCDEFQRLPPLFSEQEEDDFVVWETIDDRGPVHALEQPMDGWEEAIFVPWFAHCWRLAGGDAFDRPATIEMHADAKTTLR
jgi:hypothetical protein